MSGSTLLRKVDVALRTALNTALPRLQPGAGSNQPSTPTTATATAAAAAAAHSLLQHAPSSALPAARGASSQHAQHAPQHVDPVALRVARFPERLQRVQRLAGSLADPRYNPLPLATNQVRVELHIWWRDLWLADDQCGGLVACWGGRPSAKLFVL